MKQKHLKTDISYYDILQFGRQILCMETVVAMKAKEKKAKEIAARKKQKGGRQKLAGTVAAAGENKSNFIF
ncbi:MAG: hypothetical protein AABW85_05130 [archaeon]